MIYVLIVLIVLGLKITILAFIGLKVKKAEMVILNQMKNKRKNKYSRKRTPKVPRIK